MLMVLKAFSRFLLVFGLVVEKSKDFAWNDNRKKRGFDQVITLKFGWNFYHNPIWIVEECVCKLGEGVRKVGEDVRKVGEGVGKVGEGVRKVGEGVRKVGEGVGKVGEGVGKVGEDVRVASWNRLTVLR